MQNITITITKYEESLKIQGTCQGLNELDVLEMLEKLSNNIRYSDLMEGLTRDNGGYFEEIIKL